MCVEYLHPYSFFHLNDKDKHFSKDDFIYWKTKYIQTNLNLFGTTIVPLAELSINSK